MANAFGKEKMRFVIENPPFGQEWGGENLKKTEKAVKDEHEKGKDGRWGAGLVTKSEVDEFWKLSCEVKNPTAQIKAVNICKQSKDRFEKIADETDRQELVRLMRRFVKSYNFIVQASLLKDEDMHKLKCFVATLIPMLLPGSPMDNFSLKDKIDAIDIAQKKVKETVKATIAAKPDVALKTGEGADVRHEGG